MLRTPSQKLASNVSVHNMKPRQTTDILQFTTFLVLWNRTKPDRNFCLETFSGSERQTHYDWLKMNFSVRQFWPIASESQIRHERLGKNSFVGQFCSTVLLDNSVRIFDWKTSLTTSTILNENFDFPFKESNLTNLEIRQFEYIWRQLRTLTNAIANAGLRVRWNLGILYLHLCWLTVEQQSIPALAIASAVMRHPKKTDRTTTIWQKTERKTVCPAFCKIKRAAKPAHMLTHFAAHLILPRHTKATQPHTDRMLIT